MATKAKTNSTTKIMSTKAKAKSKALASGSNISKNFTDTDMSGNPFAIGSAATNALKNRKKIIKKK